MNPHTYGTVVVNPATVTINCVQTGTFTASQNGFSGPFTATSSNTALVTVAPGPGTNQFTATQVMGSGTTVNITVAGAAGQSAIEAVVDQFCVCMRHHSSWNPRTTHSAHAPKH